MKRFILFLLVLLSIGGDVQSQQYCGKEPIYKTVQNLALRSEEVDNASWTKTASSATANSIAAPDGTLTGDTLSETASTSDHNIRQSIAVTSGVEYAFSGYAKAGTRTFAQITTTSGGFGSARYANFNLTTCAVGTVGASTTATATLSNDGWCRMEIKATATATASTLLHYVIVTSGTAANFESFLGVISNNIYLWGLQARPTSSPDQYATTTDTQVLAGSYGTVLKSYQSNLSLRSEEFDNATWIKNRSSITANGTIAPDGSVTADTLIEDNTATNTHDLRQNYTGLVSGLGYRYSIFVKPNTRTWLALAAGFSTASATPTYYNLSNCTLGTVGANSTASSYSAANGWCRLTLNVTSNATSGNIVMALSTGDGGWVYTGNNASNLYVWGAQLNLTSRPTGYLTTTTAAATLGPLCPSGTTQSLLDPSRCFVLNRKGTDYTLGGLFN